MLQHDEYWKFYVHRKKAHAHIEWEANAYRSKLDESLSGDGEGGIGCGYKYM
jgi:hypothetical protein